MENSMNGLPGQEQRLRYDVEQRGNAVVYHCSGAFSLATHRRLDDLLKNYRQHRDKRIVLNLTEIGHIDSTGVGTLATLLKETMAAGQELILVPSPPVRDMLTTASLDRAFKLVANLSDAVPSSKP